MYRIYCDGNLLYDPRVEDLETFDKKLSLEVNKTGGFDFIIYPNHPMYNAIKRLKSTIEVYQDSHLLFRGRVLDDEFDFYNAKKVICEGDLAFFNDSVIRPFEFQGTIEEFLQWIIDTHNSQVSPPQQFALGNVTVTTSTNYVNRSSIEPMSSWEAINSRLLTIGGFIMVRRSEGVNYIDFLDDSVYMSQQEIELGENLLDLKKEIKGQDIITALIPYGTRLKDDEGNETDERLTIESVNNNKDYVFNQEAVDKYGWIFGTKTWDDVTIPQNLLTRANAELAKQMNLQVAIEVNAIDLAMTDTNIDNFRIFEYVKINSPSHLLEDFMLVTKLSLDLDNPENNKLMLGLDYATFTERQLETEQAIKNVSVIKGPKGTDASFEDKDTQSGTEIFTEQADDGGVVHVEVDGKSVQNGEPTPDYPIEIESLNDFDVVSSVDLDTDPNSIQSGETTDTISKINLLLDEPLRSVGDVKDRLFRDSDGLWKVERNVGESVFDGTEGWSNPDWSTYPDRDHYEFHLSLDDYGRYRKISSNMFIGSVTSHPPINHSRMSNAGYLVISVEKGKFSTLNEMKVWLDANNLHVHYEITPTTETLPDEQQELLNNLASFSNSNHVYTTSDLQPTLHATFKSVAWYSNYLLNKELGFKADLDYVTDIQTEINTTIETEVGAIRTEVEREYTAKSELEEYRETVSTQFENNYNSFNFTFQELIQQIETVDEETRVQFEELVRYIRFVGGNIVLGEVGNEITLQIQHDRISFLQSGAEVAYFSNNKLHILDVEILNSLQIGAFAYLPRANGSLDFKRVIN